MQLSCILRQKIELEQSLCLGLAVGETSGDIPIYSLHKIKNFFVKQPIQIDKSLRAILFQELLRANKVYRKESGNKWNCLTSLNLVNAIERLNDKIKSTIDLAQTNQDEVPGIDKLIAHMHNVREKNIELIRNWFYHHYEEIRYDTSGNIPWAVVCRLRSDLAKWKLGVSNPFYKDIEEMILEVAGDQGLETSFMTAFEAWEKMGGQLNVKK